MTHALLLPGAGGSKGAFRLGRPSLDGIFEAVLRWNLGVGHSSVEPHPSVHQSMGALAPAVAAAPLQLFPGCPPGVTAAMAGFL